MKRLISRIKLLALFTLLVVVFGCVHYSGNKVIANNEVISKIKPKETTKEAVKSLVGDPSHIQFTEDDKEIWLYTYSKKKERITSYIPIVDMCFGGYDTETHSLTIKFNKEGIVKNVAKSHTTGGGGGLQDTTK